MGAIRRATAGGRDPAEARSAGAQPPTLTIVMPAYNEEASVGGAVEEALRRGSHLEAAGVLAATLVVVVDDGSTDATPAVLAQLADRHEALTVVTHERNRGLGAALRSGFDTATTELVFYTDVDLPVDLAVLDEAVQLLADRPEVDAVSLYRRTRRGEGPRRFVYSILYNLLVRAVLGLRVRDVNFAAKLVRGSALAELDLRSEGSFIDAELLGRLHRRGHRIEQFAADYRPRSRGTSTLSSLRVIRVILSEMRDHAREIRAERPVSAVEV